MKDEGGRMKAEGRRWLGVRSSEFGVRNRSASPRHTPRIPKADHISASSFSLPPSAFRPAFTLIELLVVMTLFVIITAMTVAAINFSIQGDRVRGAARTVQSYFEGARDRAIFAREDRGVRLIRDLNNPNVANSMVYIGAGEPYSEGGIILERPDLNPADGNPDSDDIRILRGDPDFPTDWFNLKQRGLLTDGARIKIPRGDAGVSYTVFTNLLTATDEVLVLSVPLQVSAHPASMGIIAYPQGDGPRTYELELPPTVLPNQDPVTFPAGVVIDLLRSDVPGFWSTGTTRLDVLFSPRGTATGAAAAKGVIHLVLADQVDAQFTDYGVGSVGGEWVSPSVPNGFFYRYSGAVSASGGTEPVWPASTGESVLDNSITWQAFEKNENQIVSLFTLTGSVSSHPVFEPTFNNPIFDPFRYAETGEVSGQ